MSHQKIEQCELKLVFTELYFEVFLLLPTATVALISTSTSCS